MPKKKTDRLVLIFYRNPKSYFYQNQEPLDQLFLAQNERTLFSDEGCFAFLQKRRHTFSGVLGSHHHALMVLFILKVSA